MYVWDCVFEDTDTGIRLKSERGQGGLVENVNYENRQDDGRGRGEQPGSIGRRLHAGGIPQHRPPARRRLRKTKTRKGKRRLRRDERRHEHRRLHTKESARCRE